MFDLNNIKVLHLEPTTVCNAACPQCARENPALYNNSLNSSTLTVKQIEDILSVNFVKNLEKMFMCGTFGDPAASNETINIYKHFRGLNPTITLGMNTNGGIQNTAWWSELGAIFHRDHDYCVFSIDGLEDTNHIYRKNVKFSKVINNARSFIDAGGQAHWDMLVFKHNQHQVDEIKELAKKLGFKWFRTKISRRFNMFPVSNLLPPDNYTSTTTKGQVIKCYAKDIENSAYIAANGEILPCCWFGAHVFNLDDYAKQLLSNWNNLENSWATNPHKICQETCSVKNNGNTFTNQWTTNEQLN